MNSIQAQGQIHFTISFDQIKDPIGLLQFLQLNKIEQPQIQSGQPKRVNKMHPFQKSSKRHQKKASFKGHPTASLDSVLRTLKDHFKGEVFTPTEGLEIVTKNLGWGRGVVCPALEYARQNRLIYRFKGGHYTFDKASIPEPKKRRTRRLTREERIRLGTLDNEMLYRNFVKKLEHLNPERDIDDQLIDRQLIPGEALVQLKRHEPDLVIYKSREPNFRQEMRDWLYQKGISNRKQQDLIIVRMESKEPYSEDEIEQFVSAMNGTALAPEITVRTS
jgi:hypothetical protein